MDNKEKRDEMDRQKAADATRPETEASSAGLAQPSPPGDGSGHNHDSVDGGAISEPTINGQPTTETSRNMPSRNGHADHAQQALSGCAADAQESEVPVRKWSEIQTLSWWKGLVAFWRFVTCCLWSDSIMRLPIKVPGSDTEKYWVCERCGRRWRH